MADYIFKQGEDIVIPVSVIKSGSPVDLSACANVKAILKVNNIEQKKYALVPETNYGTLTIDSVDTNKAKLVIERSESKDFPVGVISIILLAAFTDATFADSLRVEEYKFNVGRVLAGEAASEIIP